jgi:hypothetical protein
MLRMRICNNHSRSGSTIRPYLQAGVGVPEPVVF